jgi:hypothetical protein
MMRDPSREHRQRDRKGMFFQAGSDRRMEDPKLGTVRCYKTLLCVLRDKHEQEADHTDLSVPALRP